jgi:NAD(P)-dependent dehydrogenase (short-subunit alcohol dehydrogenase family)
MRTNYFGHVALTRAVVPHFKQQGAGAVFGCSAGGGPEPVSTSGGARNASEMARGRQRTQGCRRLRSKPAGGRSQGRPGQLQVEVPVASKASATINHWDG